MSVKLRKAQFSELDLIWHILENAIKRRKEDGSSQWQNGYPNPTTVLNDYEKGQAYVLTDAGALVAYVALVINDEPTYEKIDGAWLTTGDFVVAHRIAIAEEFLGKGKIQELFLKIEEFAQQNKLPSVKVDTNFDNLAMLHILKKLGYTYCGEIEVRDGKRKAFEKLV